MDNIIILNSANMPIDGQYIKKTISKNQFIDILKSAKNIISSIGYESVSDIIHELTNIKIEVKRDITLIPFDYNILGLTLDYRLNPDEKGYKNPNSDDYVYFVAHYKPLTNESN